MAPTTSVRDARRARLVLVATAGASLESVAERVACFKGIQLQPTVCLHKTAKH